METQNTKKPGRNKQKSPPYQQTEQLVRTALNQGMLAKDIAKLCRKDASIVNKWKNGLVKAQTHVIAPLIERFGHAVNRHQLHHFSHVCRNDYSKQKLTEIRGALIFNWDIKEIYDADERSQLTQRYRENYQTPRFKDFITNKIYLFHRKPDKFIVAKCEPYRAVSTFQGSYYHYDTKRLAQHISSPQPTTLNVATFTDAQEALAAIYASIESIKTIPSSWSEDSEIQLHTKSNLDDYRAAISNYYIRQFQDAERSLFRQCRLHGFIESNEFLGKEIEVI